jgi:glycosyltransferase involved in cell wall biosynthesis
MNILITADQYFPPTLGGSAVSMRRLAHGLARRGHRVTVLAPAERFADYVEQEGPVTVVRCRSIPALHLLRNADRDRIRVALFPAEIASRTVETLLPDVIHIQVPAYIGASAARAGERLGIPLVATNHAVPENPFPSRDPQSPLFRIFARTFWDRIIAFCNRCDAVTAPSQTACRILSAHGLERPAHAISNGVDLELFRPPRDEAEKAACRRQLGLPQDRLIVLYAGRLAPEKRLDVLVEAIPRVLPRYPAHFVFCGTGSTTVEEHAAALGLTSATTFLGLVPDETLPLVYRAADLFVLPSEAELQGMVLLEAAATGLPLLGADALAIPEIVRDGETGLLHAPGDPANLAEKLAWLLGDPDLRRRLGAGGQSLAQEHSFERTLSSFERLYAQVASEARAASRRAG